MFGSQTIEVVIGITFLFLLLSLVCSALNEFIAAVFRLRSRDLESGIRLLLADPSLAAAFYQHPMIKSLHQGNRRPPYIPSRSFALAMMDIIAPASEGAQRFGKMRDAINTRIPNDDVKRTLMLLTDEAGGDIDLTRQSIENWFDNAMDRVAGQYKQRTQYILFTLGLAVAIFLNVDTIVIAKHLWTDQALREALVSKSQVVVQQPPGQGSSTTTANRVDELQERLKLLREDAAAIQVLGLPIGWDDGFAAGKIPPHLAGWLITAFSISLGAPFWFDMLNKIMVVRSTIKPHEKSPEQPSKDRPAPDVETDAEDEEPTKD